jgi:glycosyltransferase involved in cell wall biosynthesis
VSTHVIVPVKNEWELTRRLLLSLDADEVDDVLVIDNGSTDITPTAIRSWQRQDYRGIGRKLHRTSQPDLGIYGMWNHGFARACPSAFCSPCYVLVTNNDIELPPGAISALRACLRETGGWVAYPDYDAPWDDWRAVVNPMAWRSTRGVLSEGGMLGACFMLAGHRIPWRPLITDATYEWWYGDNHLAEEIEQHGGAQIRVEGLPVKHVNEGTASKLHPGELYGMKYRDRHRWLTRYERNT